MGVLTPVTTTKPRDDIDPALEADRLLYVKSFLLMRVVVGIVGVALPTVLLIGNFALTQGFDVRGSLSSYYHSGMRDFFVSSLCAIGVFLVSYKIAERNLDNTATVVAGIAAIGVAIFPTNRLRENGNPVGGLTPLQDALTEHATATVHFICAVITMSLLAVVSWLFGVREAERRKKLGRRTAVKWDLFHKGCALVIVLAMILVGLSKLSGVFEGHSVLVGEAVMLYAFGVSWFFKGLERKVLRTKPPATDDDATTQTTATV